MRIVSLVNVQEAPIFDRPTLRRILQYHVFQLLGDHIVLPAPRSWRLLQIRMVNPLNAQAASFLFLCHLASP